MHSKGLSNASTVDWALSARPATSIDAGVLQQNRLLRQEAESLRQQLGKTKREMLKVYEENLELKEVLLRSKEAVFMRQCQEQMARLKMLVQELNQAKSIGSNQREQVKDRIIMKLEDELISVKIQLRQAKFKQSQ